MLGYVKQNNLSYAISYLKEEIDRLIRYGVSGDVIEIKKQALDILLSEKNQLRGGK